MMQIRCRNSRKKRSSGFTLLEVLLTALLSTVLLAGLWSLFSLYLNLFESGQTQTERSQLIRAVTQQIADDLHSTTRPYRDQRAVRSEGFYPTPPTSGISDSILAETTLADPTVDPVPAPLPPSPNSSLGSSSPAAGAMPVGLVGTQTSLQLDILQAALTPHTELETAITALRGSRRSDANARLPGISRVPELRRVNYTFQPPHGAGPGSATIEAGLLRHELDWEIAYANMSEAAGNRGVDTSAPPPASSNGSLGSRAQLLGSSNEEPWEADDTVMWVPEVLDLEFRYYDGSQWSSQWDSRQRESLPIAVEVKMLVGSPDAENPPTLASLDRQRADDQTRDYAVYRSLVHLPGSSVDAASHSSGFQTPAFQPPGASVP